MDMQASTRVVLLGSGTPNCEPERYQSAAAVTTQGVSVLIDCGGGTVQRLAQAAAGGHDALAPQSVLHLLLTHLHPDHTVGLADMLIAPWVLGRVKPLNIFGPTGTRRLIESLLAAYEVGIAEHRDGLAPIDAPLRVDVTEIDDGWQGALGPVQVSALQVQHGGLDAFAFRLETADRAVVFSGDTRPVAEMIPFARGCDLLVHELYSAGRLRSRPPRWQKYHRAVHTSATELAELAREIRPKLLLLTHALLWGATPDQLLAEVRAGYAGPVIFGQDLGAY